MKKLAKGILVILLFLILLFLIYVLVTFPPIMGGMAAKTLCSCIFVSERTVESVVKRELQVFPGLDKLDFDIDHADSSVTARVLWQQSKAIYRKGLGCTLLSEATEQEVRRQRFAIYNAGYPDQDTITWPMGDRFAVTTSSNADRRAIEKVVDDAFTENDPEKPKNTHAVVVVYNG